MRSSAIFSWAEISSASFSSAQALKGQGWNPVLILHLYVNVVIIIYFWDTLLAFWDLVLVVIFDKCRSNYTMYTMHGWCMLRFWVVPTFWGWVLLLQSSAWDRLSRLISISGSVFRKRLWRGPRKLAACWSLWDPYETWWRPRKIPRNGRAFVGIQLSLNSKTHPSTHKTGDSVASLENIQSWNLMIDCRDHKTTVDP